MDYNPTSSWNVERLDFTRIDVARVRHDEDMFLLVCSASFVESGSDLYTRSLIAHFERDRELRDWLSQHWEREELQHGRALATYVRHVWPEFDWDGAFKGFLADYGAICTAAQLESSRGLELAARCVVETGTASLYRALNDLADEPVLRELTGCIKSDEVRHYKHFYQHFLRYREQEGLGRYRVFRAILRRVNEIRREDADMALRHVFNQCYPGQGVDEVAFRRVAARTQALLRQHMPAEMTMKMLLKPLALPARLQNALERPLTSLSRKLFLA
ncbi:ferritin-like domain-containing protein [Dyella sp. A6]|uniref:ferritin-like domain-containing protein n=1 Tax=Dyella aluminiiresistens TaxID=3069105 RepID=UPI002E761484|nr:ferritin-like domain-containing protein [Dyella sp. A6]